MRSITRKITIVTGNRIVRSELDLTHSDWEKIFDKVEDITGIDPRDSYYAPDIGMRILGSKTATVKAKGRTLVRRKTVIELKIRGFEPLW